LSVHSYYFVQYFHLSHLSTFLYLQFCACGTAKQVFLHPFFIGARACTISRITPSFS
jgi:hypothetical protein